MDAPSAGPAAPAPAPPETAAGAAARSVHPPPGSSPCRAAPAVAAAPGPTWWPADPVLVLHPRSTRGALPSRSPQSVPDLPWHVSLSGPRRAPRRWRAALLPVHWRLLPLLYSARAPPAAKPTTLRR